MQLTVREICDMITSGRLNYNQSTQRQFIYAEMPVQLTEGTTTKAGSLIHSILEHNIQLPAVYFWHNTDTGMTNIHDGKQRLLSLYYYINPTSHYNITTRRNGRETIFDWLSEEDQDKLLNYTFDIVERSGNSEEEEESFYLINKNPVALTNYECLSGMLHGTFLNEFEAYITSRAKQLDAVKPIGRGDQAYKFLMNMFGLDGSSKKLDDDTTLLSLSEKIKPVRNQVFDAKAYGFDKTLNNFNSIIKATKIKEERALEVAAYITERQFDLDDIVNLYTKAMKQINDISSWQFEVHRTFIESFLTKNIMLDPQRFFTKDIKDELYRRSPRCANIDEEGNRCTETSYSKLEVDHITPWSKGGRTTLDNAVLLCKSHNAAKGNRD